MTPQGNKEEGRSSKVWGTRAGWCDVDLFLSNDTKVIDECLGNKQHTYIVCLPRLTSPVRPPPPSSIVRSHSRPCAGLLDWPFNARHLDSKQRDGNSIVTAKSQEESRSVSQMRRFVLTQQGLVNNGFLNLLKKLNDCPESYNKGPRTTLRSLKRSACS